MKQLISQGADQCRSYVLNQEIHCTALPARVKLMREFCEESHVFPEALRCVNVVV